MPVSILLVESLDKSENTYCTSVAINFSYCLCLWQALKIIRFRRDVHELSVGFLSCLGNIFFRKQCQNVIILWWYFPYTEKITYTGFEVLTAVTQKSTKFWAVTPCILVVYLLTAFVALRPRRQYSSVIKLKRTKWCTWEDNITVDLKELGYETVDWIHLAPAAIQWQALVSMVMDLRSQ